MLPPQTVDWPLLVAHTWHFRTQHHLGVLLAPVGTAHHWSALSFYALCLGPDLYLSASIFVFIMLGLIFYWGGFVSSINSLAFIYHHLSLSALLARGGVVCTRLSRDVSLGG